MIKPESDGKEELDNASNMRIIVSKLPFKLRDKWKSTARTMLEQQKCRSRFNDLVKFIERFHSLEISLI